MLVCENHHDKAWPDECDCGPGMADPAEIMRAALEDIARGHDEHQSYSGSVCSQIAREALAKVKRLA